MGVKMSEPVNPVAEVSCRNMISVASGKGGVGKTWFSATLCHALAKRGQRVLLFDGDLGLANVDIQLGLTPTYDLGHVIGGEMSLAAAVTKYPEGGFDILAGRSGSGNLATLSAVKLGEIRSSLIDLAAAYDRVIVDLGAGVDRAVRQMAAPAALKLIVFTDEPTSIADAYALIKLSWAADPTANLQAVVNMASTANDGRKVYDTLNRTCEGFLHRTLPLAGIIRRDTRVRDAIRAQTPLLVRSPNSDAAADVEVIAGALIK